LPAECYAGAVDGSGSWRTGHVDAASDVDNLRRIYGETVRREARPDRDDE
jgi:hypothetical protein